MDEALKLKIDSSQARQDLDALAKSLDKASKAAGQMQSNLAKGVDKSNEALVRGARNMERFAQVTAQLAKVKLSGDPAKQITEFAKAVAAVAKVREISNAQLNGLAKFVAVGAQVSKLRFTTESFAGLRAFTQAVDGAARARTIAPAKMKSWVDFISVAAQVSRLRISPATSSSLKVFGEAMDAVARSRSISPAKLAALKGLFTTLAAAKPIPNAAAIARDLDMIAVAAGRAQRALEGVRGARAGSGVGRVSAGSSAAAGMAAPNAKRLNEEINKAGANSAAARKGVLSFGNSLDGLSARFKLSYQAGTLFSAMFASFTFGQLVKGVYDTSVTFQKLNKAMLFVTGTYAGAHKATQDFIGISNQLGASIEKNADAYGRFAISSSAAGLKLSDINGIYKGTQMALTAVGASVEQTGYAFYGLSQMMSKGKIMSEEFNRQVGEQIPGNAQAGARALSKLTGQQKSVADLFDMMRKGAIQSGPFLKLWAAELQRMYAPLLPEAAKRPDFQLNRLTNAFSLFKKAVGESSFIGAVVTQFRKLADTFMVTDKTGTHLSAVGQKIANSFGKGLAQAVNLAGSAIAFIVDHLDALIGGMKALLTLAIAGEIGKWSKSMVVFADKVTKASFANGLFITSEKKKAAVTMQAEAEIATAAGAGSMGGRIGDVLARNKTLNTGRAGPAIANAMGGKLDYQQLRAAGHGHEDAMFYAAQRGRSTPQFSQMSYLMGEPTAQVAGGAVFGRRTSGMAMNTVAGPALASRGPAARIGANMGGLARLGGLAGGAASGAAAGFVKLGQVLPGIGTLVTGAAIALALFGNKLTEFKTQAGNAVSYNDIVKGSLDDIGVSISNWVKTMSGGTVDMVANGIKLGNVVALILASVKTVVGGLFVLASTIGKVLGTVIYSIIDMVYTLATTVGKALSGDLAGARKAWDAGNKSIKAANVKAGSQIASDFKVFDTRANYEAILNGAQRSADGKGNDEVAARAAEIAKKQTEAALAGMRAADAQAAAANDLKAAVSDFADLTKPLSFSDVEKAMDQIGKSLPAAVTKGVAEGTKAAATPANDDYKVLSQGIGSAASRAVDVVKGYEGYIRDAKYDVNHYRVGYGSSTVTDAQGRVSKVTANTRGITEADADRDLQRRLSTEFMPKARAAIGEMWDKLGPATQAALASVTYNYGNLPSDIAKAARTGNTATIADAVEARAGDNKGVNRRRRMSEGEYIRTAGYMGQVEQGTLTAASGVAAQGNESDAESIDKKRVAMFRRYQSILGQGAPGLEAQADYENSLAQMIQVAEAEADLAEKAKAAHLEFRTFLDKTKLKEVDEFLRGQRDDKMDPLRVTDRQDNAAYKAAELAAKGMQDEAGWAERLADLAEKRIVLAPDVLQMHKDEYMAIQRKNRALAAGAELTDATNKAEIARIARTGSQRDAAVAGMVDSAYQGGTLADKMARARADGNLGTFGQTFDVNDQARRGDVRQQQDEQAREIMATARLSPSSAGKRDDYKNYLKDITGSVHDYLGAIEADATEADKKWAMYMANVKYAAENPPGFQKWADSLEPLANRLEDIKANFAESLSGAITDAFMGDKVDWQAIMKDITRQFVKARVDTAIQGLIYKTTGAPGAQAAQPASGGVVSRTLGGIKSLFTGKAADAAQVSDSAMGSTGAAASVDSVTIRAAVVQLSGDVVQGAGGVSGGGGSLSKVTQVVDSVKSAADSIQALSSGTIAANDNALTKMTVDQTGGPGFVAAGAGLPTAGSIGAGGGGFMSMLKGGMGKVGSLFGGGSGASAVAAQGQAGGIMAGLAGVNTVLDLLGIHKKKKKVESYHTPGGVIGQMSTQTMSGTEIGAKSNLIAGALNLGLNIASGGAYGQYAGIGNMIGSTIGRFKEGGYTGSPVSLSSVTDMSAWAGAPHYREGTQNTSMADGGMPAIVHPDEAVIPLSRGRSIPVDMSGMASGGGTTVNSTIIVNARDANSFRASESSIARKQNRTLKRAALRNAS